MLPRSSVEAFVAAYRQGIRLTAAEGALLPWLMLACRTVDALWTDGVDPLIDHRRELHLAQELYAWLMANAAFLQEAFCRALALPLWPGQIFSGLYAHPWGWTHVSTMGPGQSRDQSWRWPGCLARGKRGRSARR
jgi:hypothetical protein